MNDEQRAGFVELVQGPLEGVVATVEFTDQIDGSIRVETSWSHGDEPVGFMVVVAYPDRWHFSRLDLEPDWQDRGINTFLHEVLPDFAKGLGVAEFRLSAAGEASAKAFEGFGWVRDGVFMKLVL